MKLAVGYPLIEDCDQPFVEVVRKFRAHIAEVYFAWPGDPSGRSVFGRAWDRFGTCSTGEGVDLAAQERLEADLRSFRSLGLKLDLLLNANCYGPLAASPELLGHALSVVGRLGSEMRLDIVTTTSPFIAAALKQRFPGLCLRASVNMRIGSVQGMSYVADCFDSFHLQRDHNRDLARIGDLSEWCRRNGKELCLLANSGCLAFCSGQTFHDNLVAHEHELTEPVPREALVCRRYLRDRANWVALLQATWIRPEDLGHYGEHFAIAKLATRMHSNPSRVIGAYVSGRFAGNLLDLLEPGYSDLLQGCVLDNTRFPPDWHEKVTSCQRECEGCSYCGEVLEAVLMRV